MSIQTAGWLFKYLCNLCTGFNGLHVCCEGNVKQCRPEQRQSSYTIRAFVLWLSSFVLTLFSSPPISLQHRLQCQHSIALYVDTEKGPCGSSPPSLLLLFFFFFCTHWQVCVPWQRPWRHRWLDEPPYSALFSKFSFWIEEGRWEVAQGIRCACWLKEEKQPDEWAPQYWTCDKGSARLCCVINIMCLSGSETTVVEGRARCISDLELDANEDNADG